MGAAWIMTMILVCGLGVVFTAPLAHMNFNDQNGSARGSSCTPKGVFSDGGSADLGCLTLEKGLQVGADAALKLLLDVVDDDTLKVYLATYLESQVSMIDSVLSSAWDPAAESAVCVGNFSGADIIAAEVNGLDYSDCTDIPLRGGDYSVIAFSLPVVPELCPSSDWGDYLKFCLVFSTCDSEPTFAVTANNNMLSCTVGNPGADEASEGFGLVMGEGLTLTLESIGAGMSFTSEFQSFNMVYTDLYDTQGLTEIEMNSIYFDYVQFGFDLEKLHLPNGISLDATIERHVDITESNKSIGQTFDAIASSDGDNDLLESVEFKILMTGSLDVTLSLGDLTFGALPNIDPFSLASFTGFSSTADFESVWGDNILAGTYILATQGDALVEVATHVATALLTGVDGALSKLGWYADFGYENLESILNEFEKSAVDNYDFAFLVNTDKLRIMAAVGLEGLVGLQMEAVYVFETKEFHFTLTVEESKFFAAALKEIDNTLTWVISEVDNLGADLGTVIGTATAGLEDAGSFIENAIDTSASAIEAAEATLAKDISNAIDDAVDTTVNAVVSGSKTVYKSLKNFLGW